MTKEQEAIFDLYNALEAFVNSCYTGCDKEHLNGMRIDAELALLNAESILKIKKTT